MGAGGGSLGRAEGIGRLAGLFLGGWGGSLPEAAAGNGILTILVLLERYQEKGNQDSIEGNVSKRATYTWLRLWLEGCRRKVKTRKDGEEGVHGVFVCLILSD